MKQKYNKDTKIELRWKHVGRDARYYYWRIAKDELSLFQRIFNNPWRQLAWACGEDWATRFVPRDYKEHIAPLKTYGDILAHNARELGKHRRCIDRNVEEGLSWPDKY